MTKVIPMKKKCKKARWVSEEALQIAEERREGKVKGGREIYTQLHAEFQRFIIAYDILMSIVTFHWSYPAVINSSVLYKDDSH